jgi:hypothetical protein
MRPGKTQLKYAVLQFTTSPGLNLFTRVHVCTLNHWVVAAARAVDAVKDARRLTDTLLALPG